MRKTLLFSLIFSGLAWSALAQTPEDEAAAEPKPEEVFPSLHHFAFIPSAGISYASINKNEGLLLNSPIPSGPTRMVPAKNVEKRQIAAQLFKQGKPYLAEPELLSAFSYYLAPAQQANIRQIPDLLLTEDIESLVPYQSLNPDEQDQVASLLTDLGYAYSSMGRYTLAAKLYQTAIGMFYRKYGGNHILALPAYNNVAAMLYENGAYQEAMDVLSTIKIEDSKTRMKWGAGAAMVAFANYLQILKRGMPLEEAGSMYHELLVATRIFGERYPTEANDCRLNAVYYAAAVGMKDEAEAMAAAIISQNGLNVLEMKALAQIKMDQQDWEAAHELLGQAEARVKQDYPEEIRLQLLLNQMRAEIEISRQQYGKAIQYLEDAKGQVMQVYGAAHPEYATLNFLAGQAAWRSGNLERASQAYKEYLDRTMGYLANYQKIFRKEKQLLTRAKVEARLNEIVSFALNNVEYQSLLMSAIMEVRMLTKAFTFPENITKSVQKSGDDEIKKLFLRWIDGKEQTLGYIKIPKGNRTAADFTPASQNAKMQALGDRIAQKSPQFARHFQARPLGLAHLARQLPKNGAAVEMMKYQVYENGYPTNQHAYIAFALRAGQTTPTWVVWASGQQTEEQAYVRWAEAVKNKAALDASRDYYWKPLAALIGQAREVVYSPDGIFHQLNLATLAPEGTALYRTHSLKQWQQQAPEKERLGTILFGGALFDGDKQHQGKITPGRQEIDKLLPQFMLKKYRQQTFYGNMMSEQAIVKAMPDKEVIHLTTNLAVYRLPEQATGFQDSIYAKYLDPLFQNGIILSRNVQQSVNQYGSFTYATSDDVLTPIESKYLDLSATKLVTISGSPTSTDLDVDARATGFIAKGLLDAGAEAVIHGLWNTDFDARIYFLEQLYSAYLDEKDAATAFAIAQKATKAKFPDPYHWAAFVLVQ